MEEAILNWGLPLPQPIVMVIFSKLPIINLPKCRIVSKSWNRLVINYATTTFPSLSPAVLFSTADESLFNGVPYTDYRNPKIQCFDLCTLDFVASCTIDGPDVQHIILMNQCNDLLFIEKGNFYIPCEGILNPMTHEFFQTPACELHYTLFNGFGFSPRTKRYKLFKARSGRELNVLRFGQNNNQWISVFLSSPINLKSNGVYMNGIVYYIGKQQDDDVNDEEVEYIIYALDVETENFEVVATLKVGSCSHCAFLKPFNDTIYAIVLMASEAQLWKRERKDLWVRDFILLGKFIDTSFDLLRSYKDGSILLRMYHDLILLDTIEENPIKTLIPYRRQFMGCCVIESLHFDSLSNILQFS